MLRPLLAFCLTSLAAAAAVAQEKPAQDAPPRSVDPRIKIELFAESPQIVTPTGIDVDTRGRVWAIESNTHFRPEGYTGHPSDRVLVMTDTDADGKADRIVTFADGLTFTMSVAIAKPWQAVSGQSSVVSGQNPKSEIPNPKSTSAFIATRKQIFLMHDDDGDDVADRKQSLVQLETKGNYPHNGLAGFAFDALGWMYFGFGENLGEDYKLIGSDGTTLSGGGEGGNLYRCRLDGSKLERWATGFWNPHASCFDAFGRLFTVDNDADSRPPCRLLHIIPGGDYGYRFRNGRKGLHPFTSWNGEIPGTLPMVAGTGEAPSGIVAYESDGLPAEYLGNLLVTSWGDHRIDRFRLKPKGASFTSLAEPLITGGETFRPVGLALAPDGSLYCTDWVLKEYKLHGKGRVWRVSAANQKAIRTAELVDSASLSMNALQERAKSPHLALRRVSTLALAKSPEGRKWLVDCLRNQEANSLRTRIEAKWALVNCVPIGTPLKDLSDYIASFAFEMNRNAKIDEVETEITWLIRSASLKTPGVYLQAAAVGAPVHFDSQVTDPVFHLAALHNQIPSEDIVSYPFTTTEFAPRLTDPFMLSAYIQQFSRTKDLNSFARWWRAHPTQSPLGKLVIVLGMRQRASKDASLLPEFLSDSAVEVRRVAVQWVAEERLKEFRPQVEAILNDPHITADLFLATLAALEMLDGVKPEEFDKTPAGKYVLPLVKDDKRPPAVRARALALVSPDDPALDEGLMARLLAAEDAGLKLEAVRTLQGGAAKPQAAGMLVSIAQDEKADVNLRAEAIVGLAPALKATKPDEQIVNALRTLAVSPPALRIESLRTLRGLAATDPGTRQTLLAAAAALKPIAQPDAATHELADQLAFALADSKTSLPKAAAALQSKRPANRAEWNEALKLPGDAASGRRVLFHVNSAGCFKCHTVNGRGGRVGPDLSTIGRALSREKLVDSILEPGREIAPQFVSWTMETKSGKVHTGMIVHENEGRTVLGNAEGQLIELKTADIAERVPQQTSIMPEKLADRLTPQEFRDLLAFLESSK